MEDFVEKFIDNYFSEKYKSKRETNTYKNDDDLMYVIRKAYSDMAPRSFQKEIKGDKDALIDQNGKEEVLIWLRKEIRGYMDKPDKNFTEWHECTCNHFYKEFYSKALGEKYKKLHFGKAQKIVNMTFKYLYCFADDNKEVFKNCHMPLDKYVLDWFFKEVKPDKQGVRIPWSNLEYGSENDEGTYMWYQSNISEFLKKQGKIPIVEEFDIWEKYRKKDKGK